MMRQGRSKNEHRARNYPNKTGNMRCTLRYRIDTGIGEETHKADWGDKKETQKTNIGHKQT